MRALLKKGTKIVKNLNCILKSKLPWRYNSYVSKHLEHEYFFAELCAQLPQSFSPFMTVKTDFSYYKCVSVFFLYVVLTVIPDNCLNTNFIQNLNKNNEPPIEPVKNKLLFAAIGFIIKIPHSLSSLHIHVNISGKISYIFWYTLYKKTIPTDYMTLDTFF